MELCSIPLRYPKHKELQADKFDSERLSPVGPSACILPMAAEAQILDDRGAGAEADLVHLIILHDALNIGTRLGEGDALDPVDHFVDRLAARIAEALDPFLRPARTGIIGREGQDIGAVEILDLLAEKAGPEGRVIGWIGGQA